MTTDSIVTACEHTSHGIFNFSSKPTGAWAHYSEPTKTCSKCGVVKDVAGFYNQAASKDGKTASCKSCIDVMQAAKSASNMAKRLASNILCTVKTCTKCKATKEVVSFNKDRGTLDGFMEQCRSCAKERAIKTATENKAKREIEPITCKDKACTKCGATKLVSEFVKQSSSRDGFSSSCKTCHIDLCTEYRSNNQDKVKASNLAWVAKNKDRVVASNAAWNLKNRDRHIAEYAAWRAQNPIKKREPVIPWRIRNVERQRAGVRSWALRNKERIAYLSKRWRENNRDVKRLHHQNRRARKKQAGGTLSRSITEKLFMLQQGKCACCGETLSTLPSGKVDGRKVHLDHIMPLALGGTNEDSNMQLLTQRCNNQKCAKHPIDFMQSRGFLL